MQYFVDGFAVRRPLLPVTVGFTVAIIIGYYVGTSAAFIVFAGAIGAVLFARTNSKHVLMKQARKQGVSCGSNGIIAWLLIVSFGIGAVFYYTNSVRFDAQAKEFLSSGDDIVSLLGTVTDSEKKINSAGKKYIELTVKNETGKVLVKQFFDEENELFEGDKEFSKGKEGEQSSGENSEYDELAKSAIPGVKIEVRGKMQKPQSRRNPGCFDYALYLKSIGVTATMTAKSVFIFEGNYVAKDTNAINDANSSHTVSGDGRKTNSNKAKNQTVQGKLFLIKEDFINNLSQRTNPDTAATLKAIMFGDKGELDAETLEVFQKNGTAHILAVSGLHIGIIYAFLVKIWAAIGSLTGGKICGLRRWTFFGFIAVFFACYMVFAGFSPSVVRAVFMVLLHVFAQIANRRYDLNNAAFLVATCILMQNPYMLFNAGFQMSFLAVLTMMLVMPFMKNIYSGIFLSSLVVQIGLGPFVIYNFNFLSLAAVFVNVPVIALAGFIVPLGLVAMALETTPLFTTVGLLIDILCRILQWINEVVEVNGVTTFLIASPPLWLLAFYYLALLVFVTEEGRLAVIRAGKTIGTRMKYIMKAALVIMVVSIVFTAFAGDGFDDCNLTFVDVGQGDCMCIKADAGLWHGEKYYLIDGGGSANYEVGKQTLRPYLLKNGISHVDGAFVTHLHSDHYKGICELAREGMIKELFVYAGNEVIEDEICEATGLTAEHIHYLKAGDVVGLDGQEVAYSTFIEVLWPEAKTASEYAATGKTGSGIGSGRATYVSNREQKSGAQNSLQPIGMSSSGWQAGMSSSVQSSITDDENESCLILKVNIEGKTLLVTGDIDSEMMDELAQMYGGSLDCDILKVPHHGSKYSISDSFLEDASPEYAVIQVGKNMYGHPTPEVVEKYESLSDPNVAGKQGAHFSDLYRNDENGAIGFEIRTGKVRRVRTIQN